jgi:sec-independent protein translocase protein TatA
MVGEFSLSHLLIALAIVILFFGPSKPAGFGSLLGKGIKEFRKSISELDDSEKSRHDSPSNKP